MIAELDIFAQGITAVKQGVRWWQNPYRAGSVNAYVWDRGHTAARRAKALGKRLP